MSLARYCINLKDMADVISGSMGGLQPSQFTYETGWQRSKGFRVVGNTNGTTITQIEIPYEEYFITGLKVSMTSLNNMFDETNVRNKDYFHLLVNGEEIFESIYMKDITMYKNFRIPLQVTEEMIDDGLNLQFHYHNGEDETINELGESSIPVDVWFDIDFLAKPKLTDVTINYLDTNGIELLPSKTRQISQGVTRLTSKKISGYYVIGQYFKDIEVVYNESININFEYVKEGDI